MRSRNRRVVNKIKSGSKRARVCLRELESD